VFNAFVNGLLVTWGYKFNELKGSIICPLAANVFKLCGPNSFPEFSRYFKAAALLASATALSNLLGRSSGLGTILALPIVIRLFRLAAMSACSRIFLRSISLNSFADKAILE
jgi:hypothetical protein